MKRLTVFCSGNGALFGALICALKRGIVPVEIGCLIAGAPGIYAIEQAKQNGIPYLILDKHYCKTAEEYDNAVLEALISTRADYAVLAGFLNILGKNTVTRYANKIINVHPSLMYNFCGKGFYGKAVHKAVMSSGAVVGGATVHFVNEGMDTGPIILQRSLCIRQNDTVDSLSMKVLRLESELLIKAASLMAEDKISVVNGRVTISG